jgi:uncharacterized protein (DUF2141 family)
MGRRAAVAAAALLLALPASALAKQTADLTFKSNGSAAQPGAVVGLGAPGTYQDFPFTIAPDDADGSVSIAVNWTNQFDDWDLYVYRKNSSGGLDQVGSSAGGPPSTQEATVITGTSGPVEPGSYVIRVQNYAATSADFTGFAKFSPFTPANQLPIAALAAPASAGAGQQITLDASGSHDPDGRIVNYAWDLDGDGSMETDGHDSQTLTHAFGRGVHHVTVRVTDDKGARAFANATIDVGNAGSQGKTSAPGSKHHSKHRKHHKHRT